MDAGLLRGSLAQYTFVLIAHAQTLDHIIMRDADYGPHSASLTVVANHTRAEIWLFTTTDTCEVAA